MKINSILFQLKLRKIIDILWMFLVGAFAFFIYGNGFTFQIKKGVLLWILQLFMLIVFVFMTEHVSYVSDPLKKIYYKKYLIIFSILLLEYFSLSYVITQFPHNIKFIFLLSLLWVAGLAVVSTLHERILKDYLSKSMEEISMFIEAYQVERDEPFFLTMQTYRKKMVSCAIYLMVTGVFFELVFANVVTIAIYVLVGCYFFWNTFKDIYVDLKKSTMFLWAEIICLHVGEIFVYLLYHQILHIEMIGQIQVEQYTLMLALFYIPIFGSWSKSNSILLRMERKWIR